MVTKYPVLDPNFPLAMIGACEDDVERGLVRILLTGMHISNVVSLTEKNIIREGPNVYLTWGRVKTGKQLRAWVRGKNELADMRAFITRKRRKTIRWYQRLVKIIGERAGYENISPMTFRHSRCVQLLKEHDYNVPLVAQLMGCSQNVIIRNYAQLADMQLMNVVTKVEEL